MKKATIITLSIAALTAFSSTAMAREKGNSILIEQVGLSSTVSVVQEGGRGNDLRIFQGRDSEKNIMEARQSGMENLLDVAQGGGNNDLWTNQFGENGKITVEQTGIGNKGIIIQGGMNNTVELSQSGERNTTNITQMGIGDTVTINQNGGMGNVINVTQR